MLEEEEEEEEEKKSLANRNNCLAFAFQSNAQNNDQNILKAKAQQKVEKSELLVEQFELLGENAQY